MAGERRFEVANRDGQLRADELRRLGMAAERSSSFATPTGAFVQTGTGTVLTPDPPTQGISAVGNRYAGGLWYGGRQTITSGVPLFPSPPGTWITASGQFNQVLSDYPCTPADAFGIDRVILKPPSQAANTAIFSVSATVTWTDANGNTNQPFFPGVTGLLFLHIVKVDFFGYTPIATSLVNVADYDGMRILPTTHAAFRLSSDAALTSYSLLVSQTTGDNALATLVDFSLVRAPDRIVTS